MNTASQVELTYEERHEASQAAEDTYMRALTEAGRPFSQAELDLATQFFIEAAQNAKFLAANGYIRK